jgi:hypothetical protein
MRRRGLDRDRIQLHIEKILAEMLAAPWSFLGESPPGTITVDHPITAPANFTNLVRLRY